MSLPGTPTPKYCAVPSSHPFNPDALSTPVPGAAIQAIPVPVELKTCPAVPTAPNPPADIVVGNISITDILDPNAEAFPFNSILRAEVFPTPNTELRS